MRLKYATGDREVKEAITNIAHDLRTPLTAISGYMELMEEEPVPEQLRGYLNIISGRVESLKALTQELFQYSIAISVQQAEGREDISLNQAIEEAVAAQYGALTERGISPGITMPDGPVVRSLNRAALMRIFENILSNAIKYSDGDLVIELHLDGRIAFFNHAKSIDEVSVGRLFDRFYTVKSGQHGTGLGLSIARALTETMGGSIAAVKEGELFIIRLFFP